MSELIDDLKHLRTLYTTGPCGQSSSVMHQRARTREILNSAIDEIEQLKREMGRLATDHLMVQHEAAKENARLREQLYEATKAGTPYAKERDGINGLVIDNQNKAAEIERLREAIRRWCDLTRVLGTHRTCTCKACQELCKEVGDE